MIYITATLDGFTQELNSKTQHITGTISQEVGAINSFTFDIFPNNAGYNLIKSRKTTIKAVNTITGRVEFEGRVLLAEEKMESSGLILKSVTCESFLGYLYDSVQPYAEEKLYTLSAFIETVLNNHNACVEEEKYIYLGTTDVEVADTGNVYKGLQYQNTYETLKSKLVDVFGGELEIVRGSDGLLYLNYLQEIGTTRATTIELGKNMQQASREISPLDVVTRIIPLGGKIKKQVTNADGEVSEEETEERYTVKGYKPTTGDEIENPWIDDTAKIREFGVICATLDCSDITTESSAGLPDLTYKEKLFKRAKEYLQKDNFIKLSHTLTALDLKEIGQDIDSLNCGDKYPVKNKLIGLDEILRITKKSVDINAPYKSSITIGEKTATLSQIHANENNKTQIDIEGLQSITQSVSNALGNISSKVETFTTNFEKNAREIIAEAIGGYVTESDLEKITEEFTTKISQTARDITVSFTNDLTAVKTDLNGVISSEFATLKSYIRYYMESGKPVIELGSASSNIILKIVNDRISFTENGIEIAYISDNQLYITNATILTRLNIGNFSFMPRANGNLSFVVNK